MKLTILGREALEGREIFVVRLLRVAAGFAVSAVLVLLMVVLSSLLEVVVVAVAVDGSVAVAVASLSICGQFG